MPSTDPTPVPMPPTLVVALTLFVVVLVGTLVELAPLALFAIVWQAPLGYVGIAVWLAAALSTIALMAGKPRARFGVIVLPLGLGALALVAAGAAVYSLLIVAIAMAVVAVCLTFHPTSTAYFRAVAARAEGESGPTPG